jgi:hypothetical protein
MIGIDAKHISFAGSAQVPLNLANAVHRIGRNPAERHARCVRARDHPGRQLRLGREANIARHRGSLQTRRIVGPSLRQIERPIDEGMAVARYVGSEHTDLAVGYLSCRPRVLPRHPA